MEIKNNITRQLLIELQKTFLECSNYAALNEDVRGVTLYNDMSSRLDEFLNGKFVPEESGNVKEHDLLMKLKEAYTDCRYYATLNDDIGGISLYNDKFDRLDTYMNRNNSEKNKEENQVIEEVTKLTQNEKQISNINKKNKRPGTNNSIKDNQNEIGLQLLMELQRTYHKCSHYAALNDDVRDRELYNWKSKRTGKFIDQNYNASKFKDVNKKHLLLQLKNAYTDCKYYATENTDIGGMSIYTDKIDRPESYIKKAFSLNNSGKKDVNTEIKKSTQNAWRDMNEETKKWKQVSSIIWKKIMKTLHCYC